MERLKLFFLMTTFLFVPNAYAQSLPGTFNFQGRIYKSNGTDPVNASSVLFRVQIYSPDGTCLLYEENHVRNMSNSDGTFSINVGSGTNANVSALNLFQVFDNASIKSGSSGCSYTPSAGDTRRLRFGYNDGTESLTFPIDQTVQSVPYAMSAQNIEGLARNQILQVSSSTTQTKLDSIFADYTNLTALLAGTSSMYSKSSDLPMSGGVLNLSSGGVKVADTPVSGQFAVNKNYVDAKFGGQTLDLSSLSNGQSVQWNSSLNKWQAVTPASGTVTSIVAGAGLSGGTITSSGTISLPGVGTAGTYAKVTTDSYGRVTAGTTLVAADIPTAAGDVTGGYSNLTVAKLRGVNVSATAPVNAQVLKYNSSTSQWEPSVDSVNVGTVTTVTANSPLSVATSTSTPVISLQSGTSSGQVMAWSGSAWSASHLNAADLKNTYSSVQFPTTNCSTAKTLIYQVPSDTYDCVNIAITASQVSGLGSAAALSVGTGAGSVAAGNDSRIVGALQPGTSVTGDLAGTYSNTSVAKIRGVTVATTAPNDGEVLKYNSTSSQWEPGVDNSAVGLPNVGTAGTYVKVVTDAQGRVSSGSTSLSASDIPDLGWTKITSGLPTTLAGYGITNGIQNAGGATSISAGSDAAKPTAGVTGRIYLATDTQKIYHDNGTAWIVTASAVGAGGTVTSVGLSMPSIFAVSSSPVASSGTIGVTLATQSAKKVFAGPLTGTAAPTFRNLEIADIQSSVSGNFLTGTTCAAGQALTYDSSTDTISCSNLSISSSQVTTALGYTPSRVLSGDVTSVADGSSVVNKVGGSTAANIHAAEVSVSAATNSNTASVIVKRDSAGSFSAENVSLNSTVLRDSGSGTVSLRAPSSVSASYTLKFPAAVGANGQVLSTDTSGNLSWATLPTSNVGTVTTVTATAPLSIATGTSTPVISLQSGASSGQALTWNGSAWTANFINASELKSAASLAQFPTSGCGASKTFVYQVPSDTYDCVSISISSSQVSGLGGAATLSVGTTAGTVAAGNDSRIVSALQPSSSASGDISGTFSNTTVAKIRGVSVSVTAPNNSEILKYNSTSSQWEPSGDSVGTVTSITAGTGLSGGTITSSGTISLPNVGSAGTFTKVTTDAQGRVTVGANLAAADIPTPSGDVTGSYSSLTVSKVRGVSVSSTAPTNNQVLKYNSTLSQWEPSTDSVNVGTVTTVTATAPLSVATGSSTPVVSLQSGTSAGQALVWSGSAWGSGFLNAADLKTAAALAQFPTSGCGASKTMVYQSVSDTYACTSIAISSSQVSGLGSGALLEVGTTAGTVAAGNDSRITGALQSNATATGDLSGTFGTPGVAKIRGVAVASTAPMNGQILKYNSTSSQWEPGTDITNTGTVTSVVAGTGLTGGTITSSGTVAVDVGTSANQIVQLDASAKLPAVDASQLTGLPPFSTASPYNTSGSFIVPAKVTKVFVQVWGGGGGGGSATTGNTGGGGGAAGGYSAGYVTVTPGATITVTVGAAVAAVTDGNGSSFGTTVIVAGGGAKGISGSNATSAGGSASGTSAIITVVGGSGSGGASAVLAVGAIGGSGGTAGGGGGSGGGAGGNGSAGGAGSAPGGGGGGAGSTATGGATGGAGGTGRVIVWY